MPDPSVSFRITRSAEDLAETVHALSQRLVLLERRLMAMEHQFVSGAQQSPAELESLGNVERLLQDCRQLLSVESSPQPQQLNQQIGSGTDQEVLLDAA